MPETEKNKNAIYPGVDAMKFPKDFNKIELHDALSVAETDSESDLKYIKLQRSNIKSNAKNKTKSQQENSLRKNQIQSLKVRQNLACILNNTTALPFAYRNSNFVCLFCKGMYPRCDLLQTHYENEHTPLNLDSSDAVLKKYKCGQTFMRLNVIHLTCKICLQTLSDFESMVDHLINSHKLEYDKSFSDVIETFKLCNDNNYGCHICGENFVFFKILVRHIRECHVTNEIVCDQCGKRFVRKAAYLMHKEYAHGPRLTCKDCGKGFCSISKLKAHFAKEHEGYKYKCLECPNEFPSPYQRKKHMIMAHSAALSFPCPHCAKVFICASHRHYHVRKVHLKEKNAKCPICQEEVFDQHRLKLHMTKHLRERNHVCDICGKKYQWKKNFKQHMAKMHNLKNNRS